MVRKRSIKTPFLVMRGLDGDSSDMQSRMLGKRVRSNQSTQPDHGAEEFFF